MSPKDGGRRADRPGVRLRRIYRLIANRVRRLLRRPLRCVVHEVGGGAAIALGGRALGIVSVAEDAALERKVAFLLERDRKAQEAEARLSERLDDLGKSTSKRLGEVRSELKDHFARKLAEELNRYRPLRVLGTVALALGLGCTVAASFV